MSFIQELNNQSFPVSFECEIKQRSINVFVFSEMYHHCLSEGVCVWECGKIEWVCVVVVCLLDYSGTATLYSGISLVGCIDLHASVHIPCADGSRNERKRKK